MYGLLEQQFHRYFKQADAQKGATGTNLLRLLEMRLDNVVYRMGFANSRDQARLMIGQGHFQLNGKKADIPSIQLKSGDKILVNENSRKIPVIAEAQEVLARRGCPDWLAVESEQFQGEVKAVPQREDITFPINENLIVELYSK